MEEPINFYPDYGDNAHLCECYDGYMKECKCDVEEDGCCCKSFEDFCDEYITDMNDRMAESMYEECHGF